MRKTTVWSIAAIMAAGMAVLPVRAHEEHAAQQGGEEAITVTGEILDLACYIDHGAQGEKHRDCAQTCIESGLPVGIKSADDGATYLLIGEHKPLNSQLAPLAAKTVTVHGKLVERDGIKMIANAVIEK